MASFDEAKLTTTLYGSFATFNPSTGANANADVLPSGDIYKLSDGTVLPSGYVTVTNMATGKYRWSVPIATTGGFVVGEHYEAWMTATVTGSGAITQSSPVTSFKVTSKAVDDGVDMLSIAGSTIAAENLELSAEAICAGTVNTGASTTSIPTSAFSPVISTGTANQLVGRIVIFRRDTATVALRAQATNITASTASLTPTLTVTALTATPASGDAFIIV